MSQLAEVFLSDAACRHVHDALQTLGRKVTGEGAAATFLALDRELCAVTLQHVLDDGQTQPRATGRTAAAGINPVETLRESRNMIRGDADAGVLHRKMAALCVRPPAHMHRAFGRGVL